MKLIWKRYVNKKKYLIFAFCYLIVLILLLIILIINIFTDSNDRVVFSSLILPGMIFGISTGVLIGVIVDDLTNDSIFIKKKISKIDFGNICCSVPYLKIIERKEKNGKIIVRYDEGSELQYNIHNNIILTKKRYPLLKRHLEETLRIDEKNGRNISSSSMPTSRRG